MAKYLFASLRGKDFEIEGDSPIDAFEKLSVREIENGSLWKLGDYLRNKTAVNTQGFSWLNGTYAYKEVS